jgi:hypothetical protein
MPTPLQGGAELIKRIVGDATADGQDTLVTAAGVRLLIAALAGGGGGGTTVIGGSQMRSEVLTADTAAVANTRYFSAGAYTLTLPTPTGSYTDPTTGLSTTYKFGDTIEVYQATNKGAVVYSSYGEFTDATTSAGPRRYVYQLIQDPATPANKIWAKVVSSTGIQA